MEDNLELEGLEGATDELSDKERAWCENYVKHWNGKRAAIETGYAEKSAHNIAKQIKARDRVKEYIEVLKGRAEEISGVSLLRNTQVLMRIAYSSKAGTKDRIKAIELLNKMYGYLAPEKLEHSGTVNIPLIKWVE